MPTTTAPPILIWSPGGGTPTWTPAPPPAGHAAPESGVTALVIGQDYVDIVFVTTQPRADWTFAELQVVNVTDTAPLNIWVGVATSKTRTGFRVYLNGLPDSGNYYLDWAINGGTVATAGTATTYLLSGPDFGPIGTGTAFTVALPAGATVDIPVTVTPDDAGNGGVFTPTTVELTSDLPSANFTYTPASYGAKTISVTNDQLLTNPGSIVFTSVVATYLLSGPSSGPVGSASSNFTVSLPAGGVTLSTITVTPTDAPPGDAVIGAFTPATVNLTTAAPSATFTYTPVTSGTKTISTTNNRGLTDPGSLTYTVAFTPSGIAGLQGWWKADAITGLTDGVLISTWPDSSSHARNATNSGTTRPTYKTAIVNGLPVARFTSSPTTYLNMATTISGASPWTAIVVMKGINTASYLVSVAAPPGSAPFGPSWFATGIVTASNRSNSSYATNIWSAAFHVYSALSGGTNPVLYIDGTLITTSANPDVHTGDFSTLGSDGAADGDIAEVLIYDSQFSTSDRNAVEAYLKAKFNTP